MGNTFEELFANPPASGPSYLPPIDPKEFDKVVESRRSVRRFSGATIPETVMRQILKAGLLAPNSSNLQAWEFYWVRTPALRARMNAAFLDQPAVTTCAELVVAVARTATWRRNARQIVEVLRAQKAPERARDYYTKIVPLAYTVGWFNLIGFSKLLAFAVAGLFRAVPRECVSRGDLRLWAVKTTALACENMMLAARAYGFDSCPMEGMDSRRVRRLLGLPRDAVVVMGLAFGERVEAGVFGARMRLPDSQFLFEV